MLKFQKLSILTEWQYKFWNNLSYYPKWTKIFNKPTFYYKSYSVSKQICTHFTAEQGVPTRNTCVIYLSSTLPCIISVARACVCISSVTSNHLISSISNKSDKQQKGLFVCITHTFYFCFTLLFAFSLLVQQQLVLNISVDKTTTHTFTTRVVFLWRNAYLFCVPFPLPVSHALCNTTIILKMAHNYTHPLASLHQLTIHLTLQYFIFISSLKTA